MERQKQLILGVMVLTVCILLSPVHHTAPPLRDEMIKQANNEGGLATAVNRAADIHDKLNGFKKRHPFIRLGAFAASTSTTINRIVSEASASRGQTDLAAVSNDGMASLFLWPRIPLTNTVYHDHQYPAHLILPVIPPDPNSGKPCPDFEPFQRAHLPLLAAGTARESKIDSVPYGRRFPAACCRKLQYKHIDHALKSWV